MPDWNQDILTKISAKKDKFAKLPPELREVVLERIFSKYIAPKLPASIGTEQKEEIKQKYGAGLFGTPAPKDKGPTKKDFEESGFSTGKLGKIEEGFGQGTINLSNLANWFSKLGRGNVPSITINTDKLKEGIESHKEATEEYTKEHPKMAGLMNFTGQALPAAPIGTGIAGLLPKAAAGAPFLTKLLVNAGRGAVGGAAEGPVAFDPTGQHPLQGAAEGAAWGAGGSAVGTALGAGFRRLFGSGGRAGEVASKAGTSAAAGAGAETKTVLNKIAAELYPGKTFDKLTADQKSQVTKKWFIDAKTAEDASRTASKAAKSEAKIMDSKSALMAKAETKIKAMDEAKRYQRLITEFFRNNKKAPSQAEMDTLKARAAVGEDATARVVKPKAAVAAAANATPSAPRTSVKIPPTPAPKATEIGDMRRAILPELKRNLASTTSPEERKILEQQIAVAESPLPQAFKTENPDIIKAVSAVADVSKIAHEPTVVKVPEGIHGSGEIGKRAKDAERVAAARAEAKAKQPEPEAGGTPETALLDKEEQYLQKIEELEALGPKGKEAAKNLNNFTKGKKKVLTTDQAMEMADKVLAKLKETK